MGIPGPDRPRRPALAAGAVLLLAGTFARAQDMEPRAYSPSPVGMNFLGIAWQYSSGAVNTDPSLPIQDVDARINSAILGYSHTFGLAGHGASIGIAMPYTKADVSGEVFEEARSVERLGLADSRVRLAVNLIGNPAADRREFAARAPATNLGVSLTVGVPTGEYSDKHLINLGANRWAFKPEVGLYQPIGPWSLELSGGVWFFTDNDDFLEGARREQDPIQTYQAHVSYTFRPRLWIAADGTYYRGGETTVDGVHNADLQKSSRIGATLSVPVGEGQSVKLSWSDGATTRIGADFQTWSLAWQYAW